MPRNERSVCAGCEKSTDTSTTRRAKNILLRLFVSVRSSMPRNERSVCAGCEKFSIIKR